MSRHTGLFVKMIYLHALASAGRCVFPGGPHEVKEVGFLLEQPSDPRTHLLYSDPLAKDSVSFWRTSLWTQYAEEAGLTSYSFDMSSLGKALNGIPPSAPTFHYVNYMDFGEGYKKIHILLYGPRRQ